MTTRKHLAAEKKRCNSHNCAQAVVCTYCDLVGLPVGQVRAALAVHAAQLDQVDGLRAQRLELRREGVRRLVGKGGEYESRQ